MKFGVREICNVVFKAKDNQCVGNKPVKAGQPVLMIDTAKTSTVEGAATTVYATGGRGNTRLLAWEGEKTLTFTVEDALLSPIGFSMLSGAGLISGQAQEEVHVHMTSTAFATTDEGGFKVDLAGALQEKDTICENAPVFVALAEKDGSLTGDMAYGVKVAGKTLTIPTEGNDGVTNGQMLLVDYYIKRKGNTVTEMQIDAENFGGYYYVEADTLFRRQDTGKDMPAQLTFPKVKIQSNFTFSMASTGDPSTFTFTMDAFPDYTYFNKDKKVLCVMQIIEEENAEGCTGKSVFACGESHGKINDKDSSSEKPGVSA